MPAVKDHIWGTSWQRCLTVLDVDMSSPLWTNMELPSEIEAAARATQSQLQHPQEQPPTEVAIAHVDHTHEEGDGNMGNANDRR